jgi:hypothetical protein
MTAIVDVLSLLTKAASCDLPGLPGRRVFVQDSDRPATGIMPIYLHHRKVISKPEKRFGDFLLFHFYLWKNENHVRFIGNILM